MEEEKILMFVILKLKLKFDVELNQNVFNQ